ncbi:MAG: response regulator transcription factor [Bacteroidetes bacterium]|nr:response regulator transcription factor [Bacteroidota bacterium]
MHTTDTYIKYVVIDDDDIDRAAIESEAQKFSFLHKTGVFTNPIEALEIISYKEPDVIFLDIEMPGISGIEFLKQKKIATALVVMITSHPEFALEGYEHNVFDYLLKPISTERFSRCILRARDFFDMRGKSFAFDDGQEKNSIIIKQGHDKFKIAVPDILFIEAMKDYTRITTATKQYLVLTTFHAMLERLPAETFVRIHRSYAVNKNKVDAVQKNKIQIRSYELPVGKMYKHALDLPG